MKKNTVLWVVWLSLTVLVAGYLAFNMWKKNSEIFLVGSAIDGHHQIEEKCELCHTEAFGGKEILQDACMNCHGEELKMVDDSHPQSKFTNPRNADRVDILDARYCITCHVEHQEKQTRAMGVTMPDDYCVLCHEDIAEERPTHAGLEFDTCASAGCHNFHDNQALYEDFLVKHYAEKDVLDSAFVKTAVMASYLDVDPGFNKKSIGLSEIDIPQDAKQRYSEDLSEWHKTSHAQIGVSCLDCHMIENSQAGVGVWDDQPGLSGCIQCHEYETDSFQLGKHGMRIAAGLSPMQVANAKLPMHEDMSEESIGCASCHDSHDFNTATASVDLCMQCHNDDHSRSYKKSRHYELWKKEASGQLPAGSGVTCATCHMPGKVIKVNGQDVVTVSHNQNENIRPNEKMIRAVCMECHGLSFAIDSLADARLVRSNFQGKPEQHIRGIDWAWEREREKLQ